MVVLLDEPHDSAIGEDLVAMRRYARALTRDTQDADDVVQDAVLRAIERRRTFDPARSRRRWLLAIVHNVFVSAKRREASEARRNAQFAQAMIAHLDPAQEHRARLAQIARSFAALPEQQRAVLHLVAVEGLSYQETADALGVPIGTVMSRLSRARIALREAEEQGLETGGPAKSGLRIVGGRDD